MPDHSLLSALLIFGLGGLLGGVGGLFGIGGGLIAIPALGLLYGMDQQLAQGTSLVMIAPNVVIGFWQYRKRADIDLKTAVVLGLSAVVSTYLSARLATSIDAALLRRIFAVFMIGLALYFLWRLMPGRANTQQQARVAPAWIPAVGVVGGAFSGFFSVGGGVVAAPALVGLFGMRQAAAQGLALALVTPGAVVALFTYAHAGHVDWYSGIPLSFGGMLTISWGVALAHRMPERRLRAAFAVCLIATALVMLVRG
ncbi:sulfite exporter TauE/SafE family protein [Cupriavidus pauculus]|uniref:sulfite exporter TauE/SafE family protein n=1 Tax=Cupriavidus pauculus TaxID=82633 RepID=UPI00124648F2|nr:sulfite exporter TauE/SafE family protein [Cupriavidus pauculus]KAB0602965.1 sulfite exporter TauE/SafE family protein [Cupriavidus pauculus]UAL03126.1 sulfite exporter TauE/SafE family protein [Cupriavidus pauculus]